MLLNNLLSLKKILLILIVLIPCFSLAQQEEPAKKTTNILSIGLQPNFSRLNVDDPDFFNNLGFKVGMDLSFLYSKSLGNLWANRIGIDFVFNQGKYLIKRPADTIVDQKYFNETFLRIPEMLVKKFPIECNSCLLNPVFFIEGGGYIAMSIHQAIHVQDPSTGLSSLDNPQDKTLGFRYMKAGLATGLGISYLGNNFGRHVFGLRIFYDQWQLKEYTKTDFKPSYTSICIYYNIGNIGW